MKTLNVIGAGRVGRTLASLWEEKHTFVIQDVLDGTEAGARSAVAFIGDGRPVSGIDMETAGSPLWSVASAATGCLASNDFRAASSKPSIGVMRSWFRGA